jgi:hypothetical protein
MLSYEEDNCYRILIKSNYTYLTVDDIQLLINKIIEAIAPTTEEEYKTKLWWRLNLYTISNNYTNKIISELINYSINIEPLMLDNLSNNKIDININTYNIDTFFLIELINLNEIKYTNIK